ncbi:hypothetical protein LTR53_007367 [Teratosphaeriaceae sp. CCFEE 6253]|nr:hypothetical protein LTR53_007367 [Teratosphaeriaceae sp. CCFEE 6253]
MAQSPTERYRARALSIQIPRPYTSVASTPTAMSSYRPLSPGGRRIQNPARASDSFADPYYNQARHNSYTSPRTSSGVIPLSSETYITEQPSSAREPPRAGIYSGQYGPPTTATTSRPRRSSLVDSQRASAPSVTQLPSRSRPMVVQDTGRPSSPAKGTRERDYYVAPAVSKEPRKMEHKKIYSVNNDGDAKLVADIDAPAGRERHHRRRESVDRGTDRGGYLNTTMDRDRGRKDYHATGRSRAREASVDDKDAYSYTDPASMYATTEPKWRPEGPRPRRGSVDRGASRDRPVSLLVEPYSDPRASAKDLGPPPSTRGWESVNRVGRTTSVRDGPQRNVAPSPVRGRFAEPTAPYVEPREPYYPPPRTSSREGRSQATYSDRPAERYPEHERERETRRERRSSVTRRTDESMTRRGDPGLPVRGFGIRSESKERYAREGRGSDENIKDRQGYRDSGLGYVEPHRRDTAPEISYHEERRLEQEKKDREAARLLAEERDREYAREKKREEERAYERERKERDRAAERETERERERQRMMEREPERERDRLRGGDREPERERDRERHHHRRDTDRDRDRDRDRDLRKENGDGGPSLAQAATGGLAGAAAAFGLNKVFNKEKGDERETDRERDRVRDRDEERERKRDRDRERDRERDVERKRQEEPSRKEDRERRDRRPEGSHNSEGSSAPFEREPPRDDRYRDTDRGLGFAFERPPEPPKTAAAVERPRDREIPRQSERAQERELEREHEDKHVELPQPPGALDADEDYRRRMEQVQRELGRAPPADDRASVDSDPDRERRRRDREQRQREKEEREYAEPKLDAGIGLTAPSEQGPPPELLRRSFEDAASEATAASSQSGGPALRRKRSILDEPMTDEPVQIIDNSYSDRRENRVRIVDPPTEEEVSRPRGILKKPTSKFPDHPNNIREGVAPLKDANSKGIPPGARWTKIDRRLVNPEALEEAKERFEERLDCVIVLRVLTKEEIQKLADRTSALRGRRYPSFASGDDGGDLRDGEELRRRGSRTHSKRPSVAHSGRGYSANDALNEPSEEHRPSKPGKARKMWTMHGARDFLQYLINPSLTLPPPTDERYEQERQERKVAKRRERQGAAARHDADEYVVDDSSDEWAEKKPKMLEGAPAPPSGVGSSVATGLSGLGSGEPVDFVRESRERRREREEGRERVDAGYNMSGGLGRRE